MTRKALGRGLSALISDQPRNPDSETMIEIGIEQITPNQFQPRTNFDGKALDELAASIKTNGIIQPVVVRRSGQNYELIAGERRWRAAQRAGLRKIPAVVRDIPDNQLLELALIENIQRQELNPIEEAKAYHQLIETLQLTQEEVAERVGKDRSSVTNYLRLLKLPEQAQGWVEQDKLSMGHARALLAIASKEDQIRLGLQIIERGLSVRETERLIKQINSTRTAPTASAEKISTDPNLKAAENKLCHHLATKVRILSDGKKGKIEIEFYSNSDLDRLYRLVLGHHQ